jgi:hypothetical protein
VAFAGRCEGIVNDFKDPDPLNRFHGWIFAFNADTLAPAGQYRTTRQPDGLPPRQPADDPVSGGGIWQASTGPAADGHGNLYFATGNQMRCGVTASDPVQCSPPDAFGRNLSNSVVRLRIDPAGTARSIHMTPADWFTPYRKTWLDANDLDIAASGVVLIPNTRYLVAGGKDGMMFVLDRDHLGKFDDSKHFADAATLMLPDCYGATANCVVAHTSEDVSGLGLDDVGRDRVVQKFQAAHNQYCATGPTRSSVSKRTTTTRQATRRSFRASRRTGGRCGRISMVRRCSARSPTGALSSTCGPRRTS